MSKIQEEIEGKVRSGRTIQVDGHHRTIHSMVRQGRLTIVRSWTWSECGPKGGYTHGVSFLVRKGSQ